MLRAKPTRPVHTIGRLALASLLAVDCARPQEPATPIAAESPRPAAALELAREGTDTTQARDGAADLTFTKATSGTCEKLRLLVHGDDVFLAYGDRGTFVRLLPDRSIEDLSLRDVVDEGERVVAVEAAAGGDLYVRTRMEAGLERWQRFFRRHDGAWTELGKDMRRTIADVEPWLDGSVLASGHCHRDHPGPCGGLALQAFGGPVAAPRFPQLEDPNECAYFRFTASTDGRIVGSGGLCRQGSRDLVARWHVAHWSPASGPAIEQFMMPTREWSPGPLTLAGPTATLATARVGERSRARTLVAAFDGAAWTLLPPVAGEAEQIVADAEARPWLRMDDGRLVRYTAAGRWDRLSFPTGPVDDVGGLRDAWASVLQSDGTLWLRPAGGEFARASLRLPEFGEQELRAKQVARVEGVPWVTIGYGKHGCTLLLRPEMTEH